MVTLDESIKRQLAELTGNRASHEAFDTIMSKLKPSCMHLMREFDYKTFDHLHYGQLCSEDGRLAVNAHFLNSYLTPGLQAISSEQTDAYVETLGEILKSTKYDQGKDLSLYLFIDTARLLPKHMDKPSRHLIYNFCEPKDVAGVIASWGFLAGQINFGQNINKAIANNGPLTQKAKVRGLEIYREI